METRTLQALIARSPILRTGEKASALQIMVADNFRKGKEGTGLWQRRQAAHLHVHPGCGQATAFMGNTADAFNQVWHVPTTRQRWTTRRWVECIAREMQVMAPYPDGAALDDQGPGTVHADHAGSFGNALSV